MGRWWASCQKPMGNVNWDLFFEGLTVLLWCSQKSGVFYEWAQPETSFEWSHRVSNRLILFSVHSCPVAIKTLLKRIDFSPCQMAVIVEGIFVCAVVPRVVRCMLSFGAGKVQVVAHASISYHKIDVGGKCKPSVMLSPRAFVIFICHNILYLRIFFFNVR